MHCSMEGNCPASRPNQLLHGRDPSKWRTAVPNSRAQKLPLLPGVDLVAYRGATTDHRENQSNSISDRSPSERRPLAHQDLRRESNAPQRRRRLADAIENAQLICASGPLRRSPQQGTGAKSAPPRVPSTFPIEGAYLFEPDGSIGFRIARRHPHAALVIDPSLSITYSTFLGGAGEDSANSIATDSTGKLYIAGTTTSPSTFPESARRNGRPRRRSTDFFIAKIDPTASGANSLIYLAFLGGSGNENGGMIAVDNSGRLAITGTTTSADFPVTDGTTRTSGANNIAVTELGPTGASIVYSTLFGGSGSESTQNPAASRSIKPAKFSSLPTPLRPISRYHRRVPGRERRSH